MLLLNLFGSVGGCNRINLNTVRWTIMKTCLAGQARCREYNPDIGLATKGYRQIHSWNFACRLVGSYFGNDSTM